jgi:methionyl-tRNA synthetase
MARFLITAALPYANGPIHIGHLAGCYLPADIYVRYLRLKGHDVLFICGSDEHGVPITIKARQENTSPRKLVDRYHALMKKAFDDFGISFNHYSRTSSLIHHQTAQAFFKRLYDKGIFLEQVTQQYYDARANQFLADRYIMGTCPRCGYEKAYGDQCESCGTSLQPTDLIHPVSTLTGTSPQLKETKNWFLPLDKFQPQLQAWIQTRTDWKPNVLGQCMSWLNEGLKPRAMTRDLDWGVKVPLPDTEGKVLYVWFDAPIGYISATKEFLPDGWQQYWMDENTRLIHFIGKDNIVFHCLIFPAMLMAHGDFILPTNVPANEFLNLEGDKISTSRNWAVWLHEYLNDFPGRQDELRYVLTSTAPESKDSEFTWKDFQARINNELVAIFGNFVNRTLVLTSRFAKGCIPPRNELQETDRQTLASIEKARKDIEENLERFRQREALTALMDLARAGNKYLADTQPWNLITTDPARVETILHHALHLTAALATLAQPFLPTTSTRIFSMLAMEPVEWNDLSSLQLIPGKSLGPVSVLYEKIDDSEIARQMDKLYKNRLSQETSPASKPHPPEKKANLTLEEFQKLHIITATIIQAEKIPKADKLLKLLVDTGNEKRTVVAGIAQWYQPEKIIGQRVLLLANLQPRTIKGVESNGMILMANGKDGKLCFVTTSEDMENGSPVS